LNIASLASLFGSGATNEQVGTSKSRGVAASGGLGFGGSF